MRQLFLLIFISLFSFGTVLVSQPKADSESYIYCGCGCCDIPDESARVECLYRSKGDSIQKIIEKEKSLSPEDCANRGCSFPVKYIYCDNLKSEIKKKKKGTKS